MIGRTIYARIAGVALIGIFLFAEADGAERRKRRELDQARMAGAGDRQPVQQVVRGSAKVGRNDPCPCGSGKKYKKCCGASA